MIGYPVLLNARGWRCVIIGGGRVASRKADELLACDAEVIVISPDLAPALRESFRAGRLVWHRTVYAPGQIAALAPRLVFVCADDPEANRAAAQEAREVGALVNTTDDSASADFSNMVTLRRPPITIALATGGASPALAAHLKEALARAVGEEYAMLAQWLGDLRPIIQATVPDQAARRELYQTILDSEALDHLRQGNEQAARAIIAALLEPPV